MAPGITYRISTRTAKHVGSIYFLSLGLINLVATWIYAEIRWLDVITAIICVLPFIVRKKMVLLVFGIVTACISVYGFLGWLAFIRNPQVQTGAVSFFMGFLLIGSALLSSLLLVYAGDSNENLRSGSLSKN